MEEDYIKMLENLERDHRHALEDYFANYTMPIIDQLGDVAKRISQEVQVTPVFNETVAPLALAEIVEPQPVAQESNNMAYAGAAFGVVALFAAGAIYKKCRSSKVNSNQESLL